MNDNSAHSSLPEIQSLWDYNDPTASEERFRAALSMAAASTDREYQAELQTQIARAFSLRRQFDEAHALLDQVETTLTGDMPHARIRYLLERGRTFNSAGDRESALPLFVEAWELGRRTNIDGLAVDAAHMIANVSAPDEAIEWNGSALELAESSDDPDARRWVGSLWNNLGWAHHGRGDFADALNSFERALEARIVQGNADDIRIAKWCVARCLRSLDRLDEALAIQQGLEGMHAADEEADGFVLEEIAECLYALGRASEARPYFRQAYLRLAQDEWFAKNEGDRLARLESLANGT